MSGLRAFIVTLEDWEETAGVCIATSAGRARYRSYLQARDVGMAHVTFQRLRVRRAPKYDALAALTGYSARPLIDAVTIEYADVMLREAAS